MTEEHTEHTGSRKLRIVTPCFAQSLKPKPYTDDPSTGKADAVEGMHMASGDSNLTGHLQRCPHVLCMQSILLAPFLW